MLLFCFQTDISQGSSESSYRPSPAGSTEFMLPKLHFQEEMLRSVCIANNWYTFVKLSLPTVKRRNIPLSALYYINVVMGTIPEWQPSHPGEQVRPATLLFHSTFLKGLLFQRGCEGNGLVWGERKSVAQWEWQGVLKTLITSPFFPLTRDHIHVSYTVIGKGQLLINYVQ